MRVFRKSLLAFVVNNVRIAYNVIYKGRERGG
jgi:hypothetical protein